jgi:putative transposase
MFFETGDLYHIYNQGNNRIPIFFSRENYLFFLEKIRKHILPHADILAWCLMPNHFHLMVYVHTLEIEVSDPSSDGFTQSEAVTNKLDEGAAKAKKRDFNNSIGLLLRSYTRAIQKQENSSGSLFRNPTHAECLTKPGLTTPSFFNTPYGTVINRHLPEEEYPQVCFNYIHFNPVKARLVKQARDWEYSSYPDYCGMRNGKLVNKKRTEEFGLVI